jgi:putrescine aminotransferase
MNTSTEHLETAALQQIDRLHHLHPFTDNGELSRRGTRIISRADGIYLWDNDGHRLLDGFSGLWCVNVGYGRKALAEAAYRQMVELPYYNSFFQCTTPPAILLADELAKIAPPHINRVFFTGSGSEANDSVVRMVRQYWALLDQPQKRVIIGRRNGYHGSTVAGASLGGMAGMHAQGGLPIPDIVHIDQPYWFGEGGDSDPDEFGLRIARQLEEKILELGVERVAAFIGEPIQGAGGVIIPPASYWPEIQRICDRYGILLVADEVICGFGRTGEWFGSTTFGIRPDLMPIAKGLTSGYIPMGGVLVSDRVAEVLIERCGEFTHGFTYSGHPVAAAVALANLQIIRDEQLVERVRDDTGPYLQQQLRALCDHPLVGEARGIGFIGALELVPEPGAQRRFAPKGVVGAACRDIAFDLGLVLRATGDTLLFAPPLITTRSQIDELTALVRRCLDRTLAALPDLGVAR